MSQPDLLQLKNVSYAYPSAHEDVLHDVNLSLNPVDRVGLIGPNGCGKTTLFHLMMGLITPQEGSVLYHGKPLQGEKEFRGLRKEIGLLFQDADDQLFSPTVIEDVSFGPLNLGATPGEALDTARDTLASLDLMHLENRITHHLSGGEKKLVALATILAMHPTALLLDEPTNNLDPETQDRLVEIVAELELAHIIISHDYDFLVKTCKGLFHLERGHLSKSDTSHIHTHHHAHPLGTQPHKHGET
jgi:cobalt/nickel transport system ATP-binding protein